MIAASATDPCVVDDADDDKRLDLAIGPDDDPRLAVGGNGPDSARRVRWRRLTQQQRTTVLLSTMPDEVRRAPDLDWEALPQQVGYYVTFGVGGMRTDRPTWALAAAILATNGFDRPAFHNYLKRPAAVVDELRTRFALAAARDMTWERWLVFGRDTAAMQRLEKSLTTYYSLANRHMRDYYQHLDPARRAELERWVLPEMPRRFIDKCVPWQANKRATEERRKAKTDVLRPLAITLVAIALERRKAARRFIAWFRAQVARAESGEMVLGEVLVYDDVELDVNRDALNVEEVRWVERPIRIEARIWTPATYVRWTRGERLYRNHFLRHVRPVRNEPSGYRSLYDPTRPDRYVLELLSAPEDGLWFMPAAARQAFLTRMIAPRGEPVIELHAKEFGDHPGLVSSAGSLGKWIGRSFFDTGRVAFEPESLYRGVLYGTALLVLCLTTDARSAELVQVSADRFEEPRPYLVMDDRQPRLDLATGKPILDAIFGMQLLPKGARHETERRWYDVSAAMPQLKEIGQLLVERHDGAIPVVSPQGHKAHHLKPERYLFQWAGRVISPRTVNRLMWLVLNNIELRDVTGQPFDVTSHLLRHVGITVARHDFGVPLEVAAEILHHTRSKDGTAPPATQYYSKLPAADAALTWHEQVHQLMERATAVDLAPIDPAEELDQLLARCDEQTREVFERWHTFHPVVFGHCGRAGLCIRPTNRVLCLGCPFLNPRPEYRGRAEHYQAAYTVMAADLEASGAPSEAREHRRLAALCSKLIHEMELLRQAESTGRRRPPTPVLTGSGVPPHAELA